MRRATFPGCHGRLEIEVFDRSVAKLNAGDVEVEARSEGRVVAVVAMIEMGRFAPERADGDDRSEQSTG